MRRRSRHRFCTKQTHPLPHSPNAIHSEVSRPYRYTFIPSEASCSLIARGAVEGPAVALALTPSNSPLPARLIQQQAPRNRSIQALHRPRTGNRHLHIRRFQHSAPRPWPSFPIITAHPVTNHRLSLLHLTTIRADRREQPNPRAFSPRTSSSPTEPPAPERRSLRSPAMPFDSMHLLCPES